MEGGGEKDDDDGKLENLVSRKSIIFTASKDKHKLLKKLANALFRKLRNHPIAELREYSKQTTTKGYDVARNHCRKDTISVVQRRTLIYMC